MVKQQFPIARAHRSAGVRKTPDINRPEGCGPLPLIVRSRADIEALSASPKALKRLPPEGLVVDVPGLDETGREAFRLQIRKYIRACGCAAGGATFLLTSVACIACAGYLAFGHAWSGAARTIVAGVILVPIFTMAAKFLGLRFARLRFRRSCARLIRSLSGDPAVHQIEGGFS
jgi:hypothetical protein